tara:strand:+ start:8114 stop:8953 length:840 start_codon:yes stop_codon:yes gene_type:complete
VHWDDLRYLEALTRHGSATAAAREIGVAVSTVYRRLGALEESLGGPVVVKGAEGVVLTDAGRVLVDAARRTAVEVGAARQMATGDRERVAGVVGLTTVEGYVPLLERPLRQLADEHPELRIDLHIAYAGPSVRRREVEVAIAVVPNPPTELWGRKIAPIEFGVFGTAEEVARPARRWIVCGPPLEHIPEARFERSVAERVSVATGSRLAMFALVRGGAGIALLPRAIAALYPELVEVDEHASDTAALTRDAWLLTHPDNRDDGNVRALMSVLANCLGAS